MMANLNKIYETDFYLYFKKSNILFISLVSRAFFLNNKKFNFKINNNHLMFLLLLAFSCINLLNASQINKNNTEQNYYSTDDEFQKIEYVGVHTKPKSIIHKRNGKSEVESNKYILLNGFGSDFNLTLKSTNDFLILNLNKNNLKSDNHENCFYSGYVNNDVDDSSVYINLCRDGLMLGGFYYNNTDYFIEPYAIVEDNYNDKDNLQRVFNSLPSISLVYDNSLKHEFKNHLLYKYDNILNKNQKNKHDMNNSNNCVVLGEDEYKEKLKFESNRRPIPFNFTEHIKNEANALNKTDFIIHNVLNKEANEPPRRQRRSSGNEYEFVEQKVYLEVLVAVDRDMSKFYGNGLNDYILTLMFMASEVYKHQSMKSPIQLVISDLVYFDDIDNQPNVYPSSVKQTPNTTWESEKSLDRFCEWSQEYRKYLRKERQIEFDIAVFITKENICQSETKCDTLGMARLGMACNSAQNCAIAEDSGLGTAFTIAHEIGHLLGMAHDTEVSCPESITLSHQTTFIMAPTLDLTKQSYRWSECSIQSMLKLLNSESGDCLFNVPQPPLPSRETPQNTRYLNKHMEDLDNSFRFVLPGERYTPDQQCQQMFGKKSHVCSYTTPCKILWCRSPSNQDGACRTSNTKWAEGTMCGDSKYCIGGNCVSINQTYKEPVNGGWTQWSAWTSCSRTCGGGIRKSVRSCTNPEPKNGGTHCVGHRVVYESCNIKDCAEGSVEYREIQCRAAANDPQTHQILKSQGYDLNLNWKAHYPLADRHKCKLMCSPLNGQNGNIYFGRKVIDGTKCDLESNSLCVNGVCRHAGCDNVLNSTTKFDNCGICGGDNSTCKLVKFEIESPRDFGYHELFRIPEGATNIIIKREKSSENVGYFSVRGILNHNYVVHNYPSEMKLAHGGKLSYSVNSNENPYEEIIKSSGIIKQELQIECINAKDNSYNRGNIIYASYYTPLSQEELAIARYNSNYRNNKKDDDVPQKKTVNEYQRTMPNDYNSNNNNNNVTPNRNQILSADGTQSQNAECSKECNGQTPVRSICIDERTNQVVDKKYCAPSKLKTEYKACNTHCRFVPTKMGSECKPLNGNCGTGTLKHDIRCFKADSVKKTSELVDLVNCDLNDLNGLLQNTTCEIPCLFKWAPHESACSVSCGHGIKHVDYGCYHDEYKDKLNDRYCLNIPKPERKVADCYVNCFKWKTVEWSTCSETCGGGYRNRSTFCVYNDQRVVDNIYCDESLKPILLEQCNTNECPIEWRVGEWSECSNQCGDGYRKRSVICAHENSRSCNVATKPTDREDCVGVVCNRWITGVWGECSTTCGTGMRSRSVYCESESVNITKTAITTCDQAQRPTDVSQCSMMETCGIWKTSEWSKCSVTCGEGSQTREISCVDVNMKPLLESTCSILSKPHAYQKCRLPNCQAEWKVGNWLPCDKTCGFGWRTRLVACVDTFGASVDEGKCKGVRPPYYEQCRSRYCAEWHIGTWSSCSVTCGEGIQNRSVDCLSVTDNTTVDVHQCDITVKPVSNQKCSTKCPDKDYSWRILSISECSQTCGDNSWKKLVVECLNSDGTPSNYCSTFDRPKPFEKCETDPCPDWISTPWSTCSVSCGSGIRTRAIACKSPNGNILPDSKCNQSDRLNERMVCYETACPKWRIDIWSNCNPLTCVKTRSVYCSIENGKPVDASQCHTIEKPITQKPCDDHSECYSSKNATNKTSQRNSSAHVHHTPWSKCSVTCGNGGVQTRMAICRLRDSNASEVPLKFCNLTNNVETRNCSSPISCPYKLNLEWSVCKGTCGENGTTQAVYVCRDVKTRNGVDLELCGIKNIRNLKTRYASCRPSNSTCYRRQTKQYEWKFDAWGKCSGGCGFGNKTRRIYCMEKGKRVRVNITNCRHLQRPASITPCMDYSCGYGWFVSDWSQCTKTCSRGVKRRDVICIKISPEGRILNETSNKCNDSNKPINTIECNNGECASNAIWKPTEWSKCSSDCGFGYQKRGLSCTATNGVKYTNTSKCDRKFMPMRYQLCYTNCYARSCIHLKRLFGVTEDGEYNLNVTNKAVKMFCRNMNTTAPKEYLSLDSELENYFEIYDKKLINPSVCNPLWGPRYNTECKMCSNQTVDDFGLTVFSKVRLDIRTLKIIPTDFTFATARYGNFVPFGTVGDCYSTNSSCIQGSMHISLKNTNFVLAKNVTWKAEGQNAISRIFIKDNGVKAYGLCGGYCGKCSPDPLVGLQLQVTS